MFHCAPEGVDLLVVSPNESSALTPVISEVYRSGIPVILFDRKIQTDDYTAFIGANNYRLARQLARYMAEHIGYSGNVVIIRGLRGSTADTERYEGFMDGISQYPGIKVVAERPANYFRNMANTEMGRIIDSLGISNIDAVFAMNDQMAAGVDDAISPYNLVKKPFIVGIDGLSVPGGGLDYIGQGKIDASFIYPTGGDKITDVAWNILNNSLIRFNQQRTITYILVLFVIVFFILLAADGREGMDKAIKSVPDAIISDVMMPGADGYEVAAKLKSNIITQDIPIILLTAYGSDEQRLAGYRAGADSYIVKPFNADLLKTRVGSLIEKHHKSAEKVKDPFFSSDRIYGDQQIEFIRKSPTTRPSTS